MGGAGPAVLVFRGDEVESRHRVAYAVADPAGRVLHAERGILEPVYPRSAIKPLQALAMLESGAADRFALSESEIALACGSHAGEPVHVATVRAWLERLGLDAGALECGAHPPQHAESAARLIATGRAPSPLHNNCSGKHAGMLTLARHLGVPHRGYLDPSHPVQQRVAAVLAEMAGLRSLPAPAIDGCGVPTWPLPLSGLATAMARLAEPSGLAPSRAKACRRVCAAMQACPLLVAGTDRPCTQILAAAPGVVVKTGAEGVYVAALPAPRVGLALKVEDGAARAAVVALLALLDALGALDNAARRALAGLARPSLRNHAGTAVGGIRPAPGWPRLEPAAGGETTEP